MQPSLVQNKGTETDVDPQIARQLRQRFNTTLSDKGENETVRAENVASESKSWMSDVEKKVWENIMCGILSKDRAYSRKVCWELNKSHLEVGGKSLIRRPKFISLGFYEFYDFIFRLVRSSFMCFVIVVFAVEQREIGSSKVLSWLLCLFENLWWFR